MVRRIAAASAAVFMVTFAAGCSGVEQKKGNKTDIGVRVGPLGGPTTESGGQAQFVVTLRTEPDDDVVLPISSTNPAEATLGTANQIVFTSDDWSEPHVVTVTGLDDEYADGHASFDIVFAPSQSADEDYNGLEIAPIPGTNLDDEEIGLVVSSLSGPTTEAGGTAELQISLRSRPTGIVSVPFTSTDETEGIADGQSVEFDPEEWNEPRTISVEGVDDGTPDGNQVYSIALGPIVSVDPNWDGLEVASVLIANVDDDSPGITVSAPSGATTEAGGEATFTVQLNSEPSSNVIVSFGSSDEGEGMPTPSSLTFTTVNWATPQTVTVQGVDDAAADGPIGYQVEFDPALSLDDAYDGVLPAAVELFNTDDENAAVTVSPLNGLTTESGDAATFQVVLAAEPATDVTVDVRVSNPKEARVSPSSIVFTAMTWDDPVTVTVTGRNDFLADGHKNYQLVLTPSGDSTYAAAPPATANLASIDDGPPAKLLIYNDNLGTLADDAAAILELDTTLVTTQPGFLAELASRNPDVIVWEASTGAALDPAISPALAAWLSTGGRLVYSDVDLDGQAAVQSALGVTATNPFTVHRAVEPATTLRGNMFVRKNGNTVPSPFAGVDVLTGDNGTEIAVVGTSGEIAGTFIGTSTGAIAITNQNQVIVNGFSPEDYVGANSDSDAKNDMLELYENELRYLLDLPLRIFRQNNDTVTAMPTSSSTALELPVTFTEDLVINKVALSFHMTHTNDDDIDARLVAPDGTVVDIVTDIGSSGDNYGTACTPDSARSTFESDATTVPPDSSASAPFDGTWRPEGDLTVLRGMSSSGTWNLRVNDDVSGSTNIGTVRCWSLFLTVEESE